MWSRVTNYNFDFAKILLSTLDPGSAFLFLGNENMLPPSTQARN